MRGILHWQKVSDFLEKNYPRWFDINELVEEFFVDSICIYRKLSRMRRLDFLESKSVMVNDRCLLSKKVFRFKRGRK